MTADKAEANKARDSLEALEVKWPYTKKTCLQHNKANPEMEPPRKVKKRSSKKHLVPRIEGKLNRIGHLIGGGLVDKMAKKQKKIYNK